MPEISRFYGIVNKMFYNDHAPPHFHAEYAGEQVVVEIDPLAVIAGGLRPRATGMVMECAAQHPNDLRQVWDQARNMQPLGKIEPLA